MKSSLLIILSYLVFIIPNHLEARGSAAEYLMTVAEPMGRGDNPSTNCQNVPDDIKDLAERMRDFRRCPAVGAESSSDKPIVITDYSNKDGNVYVFDNNLNCVRQFDTGSWGHGGSGPGSDVDPRHCSVNESNYSPAGLHLITEHNGESYNSSNSFGMRGFDDQKSSNPRGILIHGGHPTPTSSTLGCLGLSDDEFSEFQRLNPIGGLMYNYFGDTEKPDDDDCAESKGYRPNGGLPSCNEVMLDEQGSYDRPHEPGSPDTPPGQNTTPTQTRETRI